MKPWNQDALCECGELLEYVHCTGYCYLHCVSCGGIYEEDEVVETAGSKTRMSVTKMPILIALLFLVVSCIPTTLQKPTATPTTTETPVAATSTPVPSTSTPVVPTITPTVAPITLSAPNGGYGQFDWFCSYPLVTGTLPSGEKMLLCPNGLDSNNVFKNTNAFRTAGGLDWDKMRYYSPSSDYVRLGGIHWVSWNDLNPSEGVYNWKLIDDYLVGAQSLVMDTPTGPQRKGVIVRLYDYLSNRPANRAPVTAIDGGFILDDMTPQWVKARMVQSVSWGGPTRLTGTKVTSDNGSYWVKLPCVYTDYQLSKPQGSLWNYSVWVIPKYNRPEWRAAAEKMLREVARHYSNKDVTFILGVGGLDGEFGNYAPSSFAGCGGIREALGAQYGVSGGQMLLNNVPQIWRAENNRVTYMSCTSLCNPATFIDAGMGLFQARAVDDGPNYHRTGDIGVLDWALRFAERGLPVAWENARSIADTNYLYKMFSLVSMSYPRFFSFVGGSWSNTQAVREFLPSLGQSITKTQTVNFTSYWSCYGFPDVIDCLDDPNDQGNWLQYSGWLRNIEMGLATDDNLSLVNPWVELTLAQRGHPWAKMLRKITTLRLRVDERWPYAASQGWCKIDLETLGTGNPVRVRCSDGEVVFQGTTGFGLQSQLVWCKPNGNVDNEYDFVLTSDKALLHSFSVTYLRD